MGSGKYFQHKKGSANMKKIRGRRNLSMRKYRNAEQKNKSSSLVYSNAKKTHSLNTATLNERVEEANLSGIEKFVKKQKYLQRGVNLDKQPFILFKTINKINGMEHYEAHTQRKGYKAYEFDGYWGKCKLLEKHIKEFGEENFERVTIAVFPSRFQANCEEYRIKRGSDSYKNNPKFYNSHSPKERYFESRCDEDYESFKKWGRKHFRGKVSYPQKIDDFHLGSNVPINVAGRNLNVIAGDHLIGKGNEEIFSILKVEGLYEMSVYHITITTNVDTLETYICGGKDNLLTNNNTSLKGFLHNKKFKNDILHRNGKFISYNVKTFVDENYADFLENINVLRYDNLYFKTTSLDKISNRINFQEYQISQGKLVYSDSIENNLFGSKNELDDFVEYVLDAKANKTFIEPRRVKDLINSR